MRPAVSGTIQRGGMNSTSDAEANSGFLEEIASVVTVIRDGDDRVLLASSSNNGRWSCLGGVLDSLADANENFQALAAAEFVVVAVSCDGDSRDILHDEIRRAF